MKSGYRNSFNDLTLKNTAIADKQYEKTSFTRVIFENISFENIDFKNCDMNYCRFINCTFKKCRLLENDFDGCLFNNLEFFDSQIITQSLTKCRSENIVFTDCTELTLDVKFSTFVRFDAASVNRVRIFREESNFYGVAPQFFDHVIDSDDYFYEIKENKQKLRIEKLTAMKLRNQVVEIENIRKFLLFLLSASGLLFLFVSYHSLKTRNLNEDLDNLLLNTEGLYLFLIGLCFSLYLLRKYIGVLGSKKQIEYEKCKRDIKNKMESK